jgi:signal transduction histidine kinase
MTRVIRHRLLYIVLLGVVTSGISLAALLRALQASDASRLERARDAVGSELESLVAMKPAPSGDLATRTSYIGLRGGWVNAADEISTIVDLPPSWQPLLRSAVQQASGGHLGSGRVVLTAPLPPSTLVIAAMPTPEGKVAWAGVSLVPSNFLRPWRAIAVGIAIATALLVATSLWSMSSFRRQTRSLQSTLLALAKDLRAPVPRPDLAELAGLADGIERLAKELLASRENTDRLGRELAEKERLATLGRVVAGVAHEVRNPLAAIKLRLDLTAAAHELPEATRSAVSSASQEIARLDRLVSDLLIVSGQKPGVRRHVELGELVRARAEHLTAWAEARGVSLVTEGDASAEADPESLSRAIDNLLRNAIEASPRGQAVRARVAAHDAVVELAVEDRGQGVEPGRTPELFEPFFTTKPEGTGLGLALSRAIARTHGGEVTYLRQDGMTCFRMSLKQKPEVRA